MRSLVYRRKNEKIGLALGASEPQDSAALSPFHWLPNQ
jgi:hypothetical protein